MQKVIIVCANNDYNNNLGDLNDALEGGYTVKIVNEVSQRVSCSVSEGGESSCSCDEKLMGNVYFSYLLEK